ncbi:Plasma membrane t-SNARE, secretory vesicle fusion [Balamuthia mandrillaris]
MSRRPTSNAAEELRLIPLLRFQEKGRMSSSSSSSYDSDEDVELGASMEQEIELTDFKQAAEAVRGELEGLHSLLARLKKALEDLYTSSGGEETKELQKEASQLRTELDEATKGVRSELQRLHQENNALRRSSHNSSSTLFRIRVNVHGSLLQQFKEWTRQYREVLGEAETRNKKLMLQQIQIVQPDANEEQIAALLENDPKAAERIFQAQIMSDRKGEEDAGHILSFLHDKHNDVKELGRRIVELNQLFGDVEAMLTVQQEQLSQVEMNVASAKEDMQEAADTLEEVEKSTCLARKKQLCIVVSCVLLVALLLVVGGVLGGVIPTAT